MPWGTDMASIDAQIAMAQQYLTQFHSASSIAKTQNLINNLMAQKAGLMQQAQLNVQNALATKSMDMQASQMAAQLALATKSFNAQQAQIKWQDNLVMQQLAKQDAYAAQVKAAVSPYLQGSGIGFDPTALADARSQFIENVGSQFNSSLANTKTALARRGFGGDMPMGGIGAGAFSNLEAARAATQAGGLRQIQMADLQQALANKQWATAQIAGLGQGTVPQGYFGPGAAGAINVPHIDLGSLMSPGNAGIFDPARYLADNGQLINSMAQSQANSGFGAFLRPFIGSLGQGAAGLALGGLGAGLSSIGSYFGGGGSSPAFGTSGNFSY